MTGCALPRALTVSNMRGTREHTSLPHLQFRSLLATCTTGSAQHECTGDVCNVGSVRHDRRCAQARQAFPPTLLQISNCYRQDPWTHAVC